MTALAAGEVPTSRGYGLILAIAIAAVVPVAARAWAGTFDIFDPISFATFAFLLLFVGRPAYDLIHGTHLVYADIREDHFRLALATAFVSVFMFHLGYRVPLNSSVARALPGPPDFLHNDSTFATAIALTILAAGAIAGRMVLPSSAAVYQAGAVAIPAFLVCWIVDGRARLAARVLSAVPAALLAYGSLYTGNRRDFLFAATAVVVFVYLRANRRPRLLPSLAVVLLLLFVIITPLRTARKGADITFGAALADTISRPQSAFDNLFASGDTEMIDTLALGTQVVGHSDGIGWQMGMSTLSETVLQPIPQEIWRGKPEPIRNQIIAHLWGLQATRCVTLCPTFSVAGTFYADGGLVAVAFGTFLVGGFFGTWAKYYHRHRHNGIAQAMFASTAFLPFFIWWSNLGELPTRMIITVVPLGIVAALARRAEG